MSSPPMSSCSTINSSALHRLPLVEGLNLPKSIAKHASALIANPLSIRIGSGSRGNWRSRVSRIRREYIFANACDTEPIITRILRFFTICQTATSWNKVDLPAPGGQFNTTNSLSSLYSHASIWYAALTCHGLGTRPK